MQHQHRPPRFSEFILGWLLKDDWDTPLGDFEQYYHLMSAQQGYLAARWWYRSQIVKLVPSRIYEKAYWSTIMLKNYLKTAIRNISRQKAYASINIAGLALGLTCCMLIFQFVIYQQSFDRFHEKADQIYRVAFSVDINKTGRTTFAQFGHGAGPAFVEEIPEIDQMARVVPDFFQEGPTVSYRAPSGIRTFKESQVYYADPTLLEMFTFPLVAGDPASALSQPNTLLLTESAAKRYFGDDDPIGKTLEYRSIFYLAGEYTVAGVLKDFPANSHLQADILLPMQDLLNWYGERLSRASWDLDDKFTTYVELTPEAQASSIMPKLNDILYQNLGEGIEEMNAVASFELQPLQDLYLDNETKAGHTASGNRVAVKYFFIIALFTLTIALINYINLATARAIDRAREVGVRKTIGARRGQLIGQFMMESALTNLAAFFLALGCTALLIPFLNRFAQIEISFLHAWKDPQFLGVCIGVFALSVLLSGLYPSFILSSFRPVSALKGKVDAMRGRINLRKGLVVFQFATSIALLIGTCVVYLQLNYMRGMDIGMDVQQILVVTSPRVLPDDMDGATAETTLKNEILELAAVKEASFAGNMIGKGFNVGTLALLAGADPSMAREARVTGVDHAFADLYGLSLLAGEPFREGMPAWFIGSPDEPRPVLINETAVRTLGLPNNEAALDQLIDMGGMRYVVQGVLKDFNWSSAHQPTEAVLFRHLAVNRFLSLKVSQAKMASTITAIQEIYEDLFPEDVFQYQFADAVYAEQYRNDERFATLFSIFSTLTILIACLGLFGLASFTATRRRKEIGIRKVLGATSTSIVRLISLEYIFIIGFALLLGTPPAWYFMQNWLAGFAYRIDWSWWIVIMVGGLTLVIAIFTISYQAIRAATANPVKSLRYE